MIRRTIHLSALLLAALLAGCASAPQEPLKVRVLAINDFHGNLKPSTAGFRVKDPADPSKFITTQTGGAEHLATAAKSLMAANPNHVFVAAGDLVGASPLLSALFHDEPTIQSMSLMGLDISAVGNHEFDQGVPELIRKQLGGCHPKTGCQGPEPFKGASFQYLAASTIDIATGKTILPPYAVRTFEGIKVGFIGLTLEGTPDLIIPSAAKGYRFENEVSTVNGLVPILRAQGIEAIVVLIHEGGVPTGGYNECPGISGPIVDIVQKLDPAVDLVVSGHTHRAYNCRIGGRLVTSGERFGNIVTAIDLQIDRKTRDVISASADNVLVRTAEYAADPAQTALLSAYESKANPLINRVIGQLPETISNSANPAGSTPMGLLVADAQLAATVAPESGGAQIALMNQFGVRNGLAKSASGAITFGDVYAAQPFSNQLTTLTLTGEQIKRLLDQQWRPDSQRVSYLQVSKGFAYSWDASKPMGSRVVPGSITLNGKPLDMAASYRVTVNNFMAGGGDGYTVLLEGRDPQLGLLDNQALAQYIEAQKAPLRAPAQDRVTRLN